MSARAAILEAISRALGDGGRPGDPAPEYQSIQRTYLRGARFDASERVRLFRSRLEDYDCGVHVAASDTVPAVARDVLSARSKTRLLAPLGFPAGFLPVGYEVRRDDGLTIPEIEAAEGVLTMSTVGISSTGTILLTHSVTEGRRVLTLLPDYHLCLVPASCIVDTLPEALERIQTSRPRLITTISGPSATADIEMTRIGGVHGPRTLDVLIVMEPSADFVYSPAT